jgi:copper chaperone CopZ
MRTCYLALLPAGILTFTAAAEDRPAPKPETITYRLTGLFSRDREDDLREAFKELAAFKLVAIDFDHAEVTLKFAPGKLFPGQKPERVTELVNDKVRSATHATFGVKSRSTVPRDKLKDVVIPVAGLDCKACCLAAYEIVAQVDGVVQATASFKDGRVTAKVDPSKADQAKLEEALRKRGVAVGKR